MNHNPEAFIFKLNEKMFNSDKFKFCKLGNFVRQRGKVALKRKKDVIIVY